MNAPDEQARPHRPREGTAALEAGTFRRQIVLLTGALAVFAALTLVVVVQVVLAQTSSDAVRRVLTDRASGVASAVTSDPAGQTLRVPASRLDPGVAIYDAEGRLVAGQAPGRLADAFAELSLATSQVSRDVDDTYRALGYPFTVDSGEHGVVVVAETLAPYENDERTALVVSVAAGLLIFLLATGLGAWVTKRALAPVAQMAQTAEDWSEHDLQQRFDLGSPDNEIRALGHTLDGLLDKVASAILAEQRLTSELAHELRTPLTAALGTADLALMRTDLPEQAREDVEDIAAACRSMSDIITSLLDLARAHASGSGSVLTARSSVADGIATALPLPGGACVVEVDVPGPLMTSVPVALVGRIVSPLIDNAARVADHLRVSASADGRWVRIMVSDDGPGIDAGRAEAVFTPGVSTGGGSGLGLALSRRVARTVGGDVRLVVPPAHDAGNGPGDGDATGARFEVTLPASH